MLPPYICVQVQIQYVLMLYLTIESVKKGMDNIQIPVHSVRMLNLRDITIKVIDGEHGRYPSTWGVGSRPSDPYGRLYYVDDGEGMIEHHGQEFRLCKGGLYLIPPQTIAKYECTSYLELYWIHFTAQAFGVMDIFSLLEPSFRLDDKEMPYSRDLFEILVKGWASEDPGCNLEIDGIVRQLLGRFYGGRYEVADAERLKGLSRMRPVLDYIDLNISNAVTLNDLAEVIHLHPHYFSNLFKETMRIPPMTYLVRRRTEKAQQLLVMTDDSVKRIAWAVGYDDEFYFSRAFKKIVGLAPFDYRKHVQEHGSV
jgi:AraC-like DNA-binding protein